MAEDEERRFLDPGSVSKHLYCSICMEVFLKPLRAPCGHSYCSVCIEQWLKNRKTCPEDRKPLRRNQMHFDFILENIIGDHRVACPFRRRGCDVVIPLTNISSHKRECDLNPDNLPDFLAHEAPPQLQLSRTSDSDGSDDLGEVPVMSLKMRLFKGRKRKELCSMFDTNHLSKTMCLDVSSDKENSDSDREEEQSTSQELLYSSSTAAVEDT